MNVTPAEAITIALDLQRRGRLDEAAGIYREVLKWHPEHPDALHLLGLVLLDTESPQAAMEWIERAGRLVPTSAVYRANLGECLRRAGRAGEAVDEIRRALELDPNFADAWMNLGNALRQCGRSLDAIEAGARAVQLRPDAILTRYNFAVALADVGRLDEAAGEYQAALRLQPRFAEALDGLGTVLQEGGDLDGALAAHRAAVSLKPGRAASLCNLGVALKDAGDLEAAANCFARAVELDPMGARAHSNWIYTLLFDPHSTPEQQARVRRDWEARHAAPLAAQMWPHANDRSPERALRIGYVSPDFREHVIGRNILPLLRHHDRSQCEVFCYFTGVRSDSLTAEFRGLASVWREVAGHSDAALADLIREDQIDILVDLTLHMEGNRLLTFARKPAPVQVSFAGYPGGTELSAIDAHLLDPWLGDDATQVPPTPLLTSFWCYEAFGLDLPVGPPPVLRNGYMTFGCLNNFCKINEPLLQNWARILAGSPGSRLLLLAKRGEHRRRLIERLGDLGVGFSRVEFCDPRPRREYMELYQRIDLGLDTYPYNGHTTSLDALWMGVPVVSRYGEPVVSRAGLSQWSNLGRRDFCANSEDTYVRLAIEWSGRLEELANLRRSLRDRMIASPLMDGPRFARDVEAAYRNLW